MFIIYVGTGNVLNERIRNFLCGSLMELLKFSVHKSFLPAGSDNPDNPLISEISAARSYFQ